MTDGTVEAFQSFGDERMHIVTQPNAGLWRARNTGLKMSTAPYVAFIDGDDVWAPQKLAIHTDFLKSHPDVDLSFSHSCVIDENGGSGQVHSRERIHLVSRAPDIQSGAVTNGSAVVVRRDALDKAGWFDVNLGLPLTLMSGFGWRSFAPTTSIHPSSLNLLSYARRPDNEGLAQDGAVMARAD